MYYTPYYQENFYRAPCISQREVDFKQYIRLLWEQHITWSILTITAQLYDLPNLDAVRRRLFKNPLDMGHSLKPFYGEQAALKYSRLINDHIIIALHLVHMEQKGDHQTAADLEKEWYSNADEMTVFLSSINPYLKAAELRKKFHKHLSLIKTEVTVMLKKDYKTGVSVYDEIESEALVMADEIAAAIVKQFPQMFHN